MITGALATLFHYNVPRMTRSTTSVGLQVHDFVKGGVETTMMGG
jgi:hypothetical protein